MAESVRGVAGVVTAIVSDGPVIVYPAEWGAHVPTVEEHVSPDGRLRLCVDVDPGGDLAVYFAGYQWHTHADLLAAASGLAEEDAVRQFIDGILSDKTVIALWGVPGEVQDVWVSGDPLEDAAYPQDGEVIELRYWSGKAWVES